MKFITIREFSPLSKIASLEFKLINLTPGDNSSKKPIFIMNADILTKVNFNQLLDFHLKAKSLITMCVRNYMHQIPYGVIRTNEHHIESIDEKPTQVAKVNAGIYLVNPEIVANLEKGKYLDMPSLINNELEKNHSAVSVFPIHEYWLDIGKKNDFDKAQNDLEVYFDER